MFPSVNPEQIAKVQAVSGNIKAAISVDYNKNAFSLALASDDPEAAALIPKLLKQFSDALAQQLSILFAIKGEMIEVGSPDDTEQ